MHDAAEGAAVPTQTTQPICRDYQNGRCFRASCRFYHGTSADQATMGLGGRVYGAINNAQAMYGADLGDMSYNKNPQLHMMNRTMNLPMNHGAQIDPTALLGVDPNTAASLLGGGNLNLEQALLLQTAMANGMTYDNNTALTMALANEILRRNATVNQQNLNGNAGFDTRWMNTHQMVAASAAARQHMNGVKTQAPDSTYQQSVAAAMAAMNPGVAQESQYVDAAAAANWHSKTLDGAQVDGAQQRHTSQATDIPALPDSLVDNDFMNMGASSMASKAFASHGSLLGNF